MDVLNGIVRIASGTGFIVSAEGLIVTCASVLGPSSPETIQVEFQAVPGGYEARVESHPAANAEGVAFLRVAEGLPAGVEVLPLGSSLGSEGHAMSSFGHVVAGEVEGARAMGIILGRVPRTTMDKSLLQLHSSAITERFRGAPVWDEVRRCVVGMIVMEAEEDSLGRLSDTSFALPMETLSTIAPDLPLFDDTCPYRNLDAFAETDSQFFFGRQTIIDELLSRLRNERRFLAISGPSGCGKSSLVQARLIPRLRTGAIPGSDRWKIIVTHPTDESFKSLFYDLEAVSSAVVVVDQFEELFVSFTEEECIRLVTQLIDLLDYVSHLTLIIVVRNDFSHRLLQYESLARWMKRSLVDIPLSIKRDEWISIVKEPAAVVGLRFEDGLAETIVNDALSTAFEIWKEEGNSTALPVLESTLTHLWQQRQDGRLTWDAYQRIGGVTGGLAQRAERAYASCEESQRSLVRRVLTSLVHPGDQALHVPDTRRCRDLSSLVPTSAKRAEFDRVIQHLIVARVLVIDRESVEIIHDALPVEWERLREWVQEDRAFLLWRQELERRVRAWIETERANPAGRDREKLFGGSDLTEALRWMAIHTEELSQSDREFIQASRDRLEQEERQHKQYTRRTVLAAALGAGWAVTGAGIALNALLRKSTVPALSLPYTLLGHSDVVNSVVWSPDGKRVASASADRTVRVWDAISGSLLLTYSKHTDPVNSVVWSPDGKRVASASSDGTVLVWDAATGRTLLTAGGDAGLAWSPDSKYIVSASVGIANGPNGGPIVQIWDARTGQTVLVYNGHHGVVSSMAWSPDSKWIASASADKTVQIWGSTGLEGIGQISFGYLGHSDTVNSVAWSPDGKRIASASADKTVQVWDATNGTTLFTYKGYTEAVNCVAWSPDSKQLASASADTTVQICNAAHGSLLLTYQGHTSSVSSVAWSPDGKRLVSAGADRTVQVCNSTGGPLLLTYTGHIDVVESVAWSPDGRRIASTSDDRTVQISNAASGELLLTYRGHNNAVSSVAWSPDGKQLASAGVDPTVHVWEAATGRTLLNYTGHRGVVNSVAWSPDGKRIASSGEDASAQIWDATNGSQLLIYAGHRGVVNSVAWSPNGKWVASGGNDMTMHVWNATSGTALFTSTGHRGAVKSVAWSLNSERLASASGDRTVRVWDATSGLSLFVYTRHTNMVTGASWSPGGEYLASASTDQTVQIWNAASGSLQFVYRGSGAMNGVAWSPDGQHLVSANGDMTIQLLWTQSREEIRPAPMPI